MQNLFNDTKDLMFNKFANKFEHTDLKFNREFNKAYFQALNQKGINKENIGVAVESILIDILQSYYKSEPNTKGGTILRYLSKVICFILPKIKIK